jgi:hypothetical protein
MSKMSRGLLEFIDRFSLAEAARPQVPVETSDRKARRASAGTQF